MLGVVKDGTILFFAHMNERYFTSGQLVKKGQILGTIGITGQTSGPHVHVRNKKPVGRRNKFREKLLQADGSQAFFLQGSLPGWNKEKLTSVADRNFLFLRTKS
jgi:hypothetical protein